MTDYPDAYITEVVIVLDDLSDERTVEVVKDLESRGLFVDRVDNGNSVIEGRVELGRVPEIEAARSVCYVRKTFTYAAEFPPGHPLDRNHQ
jgi:FlaA1/EpsC-like NDP-sugar epimerase